MELVTILRELRRHRMLVCGPAAIAVLLGIVVAYRVSLPRRGVYAVTPHTGTRDTVHRFLEAVRRELP
jgi:hypothetical protein